MASPWYCGRIECPNCGSPLSDDAAICPYCSSTAPMTAPWQRGRWWSVFLLASVLTGAWVSDRLLGTGLVAWLARLFQANGS